MHGLDMIIEITDWRKENEKPQPGLQGCGFSMVMPATSKGHPPVLFAPRLEIETYRLVAWAPDDLVKQVPPPSGDVSVAARWVSEHGFPIFMR
jgi:hypothetical protein